MGDRIQRNVNREIEKARGITRKRKREDKTPRIRRRRQFERMEKKHRKIVQQVKEGPQRLYTGEQQGIRAGVKKSTKL
jgi:U3 small nucleolar RNA-associated protein 3